MFLKYPNSLYFTQISKFFLLKNFISNQNYRRFYGSCSSSFKKSFSWKCYSIYGDKIHGRNSSIFLLDRRKDNLHLDRRYLKTSVGSIKSQNEVNFETKKGNQMSEVQRLFNLAKPEAWTLSGGITLLAISSTITMAVPFALGHVIDVIYSGDATTMHENLTNISIALSGIFLVGGLANFGRVYLMNIAGQRITRSLRSNLFNVIMKQEIAFFDTNRTGELINRLSADTSVVSSAVTMNISDGLRSFVMILAGVGMMFYTSSQLTVVGLSIVPPVAMCAIIYGKYVRKISKNVQDTLAEATHVAEEKISNVRTVRAFAREKEEARKYDESVFRVLQMTYKESLAKAVFFGLTGLSGNFIILSVLYYGGNLVLQSNLTIGSLSSFLMYAGYVGIAMGGLSSFYSELNKGLGASYRLFRLLERKPEIHISGGLRIPDENLKGNLSFKNVFFHYPTRTKQNIFTDFSLDVPAGRILALVGSSGSGKSTIGSLMLRFYDPQRGEIFLDGSNIKDVDPEWLRMKISSVSQEPTLFSGTIWDNIVYGIHDTNTETFNSKDTSCLIVFSDTSINHSDTSTRIFDRSKNEGLKALVVAAAKEANALSFIENLPLGFDTMVGEKGIMLSGGQKQRVAIARAIISKPKILLLDEATSALDAESESLVQEALERIMNGKTVIMIAHRLSTIRKADQIAVLDEGKIAEIGTYNELIAKNGIFKKLVERQTTFS